MGIKLKQGFAATVVALTFSAQILPVVASANTTADSSTTTSTKTSDAGTTSTVADNQTSAAGQTATGATTDSSSSDATSVSPYALNLISWGSLDYVGMSNNAQQGLTIENGVTTGVIQMKFDMQSVAGAKWGDKSQFVMKLPQEFAEISQTKEFRDNITGRYRAWTAGIKVKDYNYKSMDIKVENNQIIIDNPKTTDVLGVLPHTTIDLSIDLGKAVTDSGVRVMNSNSGFYDFQAALRGDENTIDWTIGSNESHTKIPIGQIDPGYGNSVPVINTDKLDTDIPLGSTVDDARLLENVTATDKEDGNITNKITIEKNDIKPNTVGEYDVTYAVVDSVGMKTTKTVTFVVSPATTGKITPNDAQEGATKLTGSYTGDVASMDLMVGTTKVESGGIFKNGEFTFYVPENVDLKKSDDVSLIAYDKNGRKLDTKTVKIVDKSVSAGTITPNNYTVGSGNISGTYTGDVTYAKVYVNNQQISVGGDFSNGNFSYYVGNAIANGDNVRIDAYNADNQMVDSKPVTLSTPSVVGSITPAPYTVGSDTITGSYSGAVSYAKVYVNGQQISAGGNFANGSFNYYVGDAIASGNTVTIEAYSADHQKLATEPVIVNAPAATGSINQANYTAGNSLITGTYTGAVSYAKVYVNNQQISAGGDFENGVFTYYVGNAIPNGATVRIDAYSADNQKLDSKGVSISNPTATGSITPDVYQNGVQFITGTYTGDVSTARLYINGNLTTVGGVFENGRFTYYVGDSIAKGQNVTLDAYSADGQKLDSKAITFS